MTIDFSTAHDLLDEEPYDEEMAPGRAWRAPDGTPIVSTLETNGGTAGVLTYCDEGSAATFDYDGSGTEWDDGDTVRRAGYLVFVDEAGDEWLECEIIKDPTAALPESVTSIWDNPRIRHTHGVQVITEFLDLALGLHVTPTSKVAGDVAAAATLLSSIVAEHRASRKSSK